MEAHHYCRVVNDDLLQCVLFDGNTRQANLIGIEYIASEKLFAALPEPEKAYWHPHNFELLSGQLVAPGLPDMAEKAFFKLLMKSYGKTWHTWHTGRHDGPPGHTMPLGDPTLMWSFNREGECEESLKRNRDHAMNGHGEETRRATGVSRPRAPAVRGGRDERTVHWYDPDSRCHRRPRHQRLRSPAMAQPPSHTTFPAVRKPVPRKLLVDRGTGTDYQTRLATVDGLLTPHDRFYIRSHSPTPDIDVNSWRVPEIRVRARDDHGGAQPDAVPWNDKGCSYNAVVAHPITVR